MSFPSVEMKEIFVISTDAPLFLGDAKDGEYLYLFGIDHEAVQLTS